MATEVGDEMASNQSATVDIAHPTVVPTNFDRSGDESDRASET